MKELIIMLVLATLGSLVALVLCDELRGFDHFMIGVIAFLVTRISSLRATLKRGRG